MQAAQRLVIIGLLLACHSSTTSCQDLPTAKPGEVGVSPKQIEELATFTKSLVDEGKVSGGVTMMACNGKVVFQKPYGMADREAGRKMGNDTIFRLASMSKPIASVAVMILYDQGKIELSDPLCKYIPEFENMQVMVGNNPDRTVPANEKITIHRLLTHTAGFGSEIDSSPLYERYKKAGLYRVLHGPPKSLSETIPQLGDFPLVFQPGQEWGYSLSPDILGYLIEVVSKRPFDEFLQEELFEPLGMHDTHFFLPKDKVDRLAAVYERTKAGELKRMPDGELFRRIDRSDLDEAFVFPLTYRLDFPYAGPKKYLSGAGGLCSTASDYMRFCLMLANKGEFNGKQILKPETVKLMMSNQIGELSLPAYFESEKFGYGFLVVDRPDDPFNGACHWSGANATFFWILPSNRSVQVLMMQCARTSQVMVIDLLAPVRRLAEATLVHSQPPIQK